MISNFRKRKDPSDFIVINLKCRKESYLWRFSACWVRVEVWAEHLSSFWWPLLWHYGFWGFLCPRSLQPGSLWIWSLPGSAAAGATSPPPPRCHHRGEPAERTSDDCEHHILKPACTVCWELFENVSIEDLSAPSNRENKIFLIQSKATAVTHLFFQSIEVKISFIKGLKRKKTWQWELKGDKNMDFIPVSLLV